MVDTNIGYSKKTPKRSTAVISQMNCLEKLMKGIGSNFWANLVKMHLSPSVSFTALKTKDVPGSFCIDQGHFANIIYSMQNKRNVGS